MHVNLFFNWLWIGESLTFKTEPPCIIKHKLVVYIAARQ